MQKFSGPARADRILTKTGDLWYNKIRKEEEKNLGAKHAADRISAFRRGLPSVAFPGYWADP